MKKTRKRIKYCFKDDCKKLAKISGIEKEFYEEYLIDGKGLICNTGFLLYYPMMSGARIEQITVLEKRKGVGSQLVQKLESHIIEQGLLEIQAMVPENDLESQLFFKSLGYFCTNIVQMSSGNKYLFIKTV